MVARGDAICVAVVMIDHSLRGLSPVGKTVTHRHILDVILCKKMWHNGLQHSVAHADSCNGHPIAGYRTSILTPCIGWNDVRSGHHRDAGSGKESPTRYTIAMISSTSHTTHHSILSTTYVQISLSQITRIHAPVNIKVAGR